MRLYCVKLRDLIFQLLFIMYGLVCHLWVRVNARTKLSQPHISLFNLCIRYLYSLRNMFRNNFERVKFIIILVPSLLDFKAHDRGESRICVV